MSERLDVYNLREEFSSILSEGYSDDAKMGELVAKILLSILDTLVDIKMKLR